MSLSSVTRSAQRAAANIKAAGFTPARRGDIAVLGVERSSAALHGATTRYVDYVVTNVTSVTRDGLVKATGATPCGLHPGTRLYLVSADLIPGRKVDELLRRLARDGDGAVFPPLDQARNAIRFEILAMREGGGQ